MDRPGQHTGERYDEDRDDLMIPRDWGDDWVHELIAMTRPGLDINLPTRGLGDRVLPFQFDDFN